MGDGVKTFFNNAGKTLGGAIGLSQASTNGPDFGNLGQVEQQLYNSMTGESPIAKAQNQYYINSAFNNANNAIAGQRGITSGQKAAMMNNLYGNLMNGIAGQSIMADAQERMNAGQNLGNILLNKAGLISDANKTNAALQDKQFDRFGKFLGSGFSNMGQMSSGGAGGTGGAGSGASGAFDPSKFSMLG